MLMHAFVPCADTRTLVWFDNFIQLVYTKNSELNIF